MRRGEFAACLLAALCGGCAAQAVPKQAYTYTYTFNSTEVLSAAQKPAGFYPGYADIGLINIAGYNAWLAQNQPRVDEIQTLIGAIREGRTAPGCIGEDQYTCVATLAQKFAVADYSQDRSVIAEPKYDVNGKPLTRKFEILGYVPRPDIEKRNPEATLFPTHFVLKMAGNGKVSALEVEFVGDPTLARTQEEYDATDAYEAVSAITAKNCPTLSRIEVAKWIENTIKPKLKSYRGRVRRGTAELELSKKTSFCGRTFQFGSLWVRRGSKIGGEWALVVE
jgi:hypothetical protein